MGFDCMEEVRRFLRRFGFGSRLLRMRQRIRRTSRALLQRASHGISRIRLYAGNSQLRYYRRVEQNAHVFVYAVLGRSSSTALQRIINSSGQVFMYGESWGAVDRILDTIHDLSRRRDGNWQGKVEELDVLEECFKTGKHDVFYARAFKPIDRSILLLRAVLADLLQPPNGLKRFGVKEVAAETDGCLPALRETFPQSRMVFLFRHPVPQWVSVAQKGFLNYSDSVEHFLRQYKEVSDRYLRFHSRHPECSRFVRNDRLYDADAVSRLLEELGIDGYDRGLIGDGLSSVGESRCDAEVAGKIRRSEAFGNYRRMCEICGVESGSPNEE